MAQSKASSPPKKKMPHSKTGQVKKKPAGSPQQGGKKYRELYETEQRHALELAMLNEMTRSILASQDLDLVLVELAGNLAKLLEADDCFITRWDEEQQRTIPKATTARLKSPYEKDVLQAGHVTMTSSVLREGRALTAEDASQSPHIDPEIARRYPSRSIMGAPLVFRENKLGALIVAFNTPHRFTPEEMERAERTANHVAVAIWNAEQDSRIKQRLKEQETLARITTALSQTERVGLPNVLKLIVHSARELIPKAQQAVIHLMDREQAYLTPEAVSGFDQFDESRGRMRVGEGIAGLVIAGGQSIYIPSVQDDSRFVALNPRAKYRSLLVSPIISGEKEFGTISIQSEEPHAFSQNEINLLGELGQQAAIGIENARLYDAEREQRLRAETSAEATLALVSHLEQSEVLNEILNQVQRLLPGCAANVGLLEGEHIRTAAWRGYENRGDEVFEGLTKTTHLYQIDREIIENPRSSIISDTTKDPRWRFIPGLEWVRSNLCLPLLWNEELLGLLYIDGDEPEKFSEETISRLRPLVNATTAALESALLINTTRQALKETSALYHINQKLVALDASELMNDAVELLKNKFDYYHVQVFVIETKSGDLLLKAASGEVGKRLVKLNHRVRAGSGIVGYAAETGSPFFTNHVDEVVFFQQDPSLPDTTAEMAIPARHRKKLYGILDIQQDGGKPFTKRDEQLVINIADQLAVALHKAELYENLQTALRQEKAMRSQLVQNERLAIMGRLLASVSHELNNPLQAIQNALFLLKDEQGLSPQGLSDLEIVLAESERMSGLIERLRDTYRPPHAEEFQETQINAVIEDVYALLAAHLRKNDVAFEFHPDQDLPAATVLPDQIKQVIINLFINAVEAMPGGGKLSVSSAFLKGANETLVSIADTGAGIFPSILPFIFEPFITNKKEGTGIGLTISHEIVIKHGGRIAAENNPNGRGAIFKVWLPIKPPPAEVSST